MILIAAYVGGADGRIPTSRGELIGGLLHHEDRYWSWPRRPPSWASERGCGAEWWRCPRWWGRCPNSRRRRRRRRQPVCSAWCPTWKEAGGERRRDLAE